MAAQQGLFKHLLVEIHSDHLAKSSLFKRSPRWFLSALAWPICTVWLGPLGPAYVAYSHLCFWLLGVLVLLSFTWAHQKELLSLDWKLHDELVHLESDDSRLELLRGMTYKLYYLL